MSPTPLHTITCSAFPQGTRLIGFKGTEGLSRLYRFDVYVAIVDDASQEFELADAIGARASIEIARPDGEPSRIHGVLAAVELVQEVAGRALVHAILMPQLWQLTLSRHSRIFTDQSVPDVLKAVLRHSGIAGADVRVEGNYKLEEHVCQYQESDFDFLCRWMEREGLYFFFEQGDDEEKLVITDARSPGDSLRTRPVRYHPTVEDDVTATDTFSTFTCKHVGLPGKVKLRDYDYMKPTLDVSGEAAVAAASTAEVAVHGARFFAPDQGKHLADVRAQERLAGEVRFTGSGIVFGLRAGYPFEVDEHPRGAFNTKYLATEVVHYGNQAATTPEMRRLTGLERAEVYWVEVTALVATTRFRAPSSTLVPHIYGVEVAVVDGAAESEYAQLDKAGRYKVRFQFDESDLDGGKASTWMRMLQPHGGNPEGWHFPLRKGTEVLVVFLGGDPDRPVITGAVPNAQTPSPVTASNHTQNVVHTGGNTRIEIEDKAGSQYLDISTPPQESFWHVGKPHGKHTHYIVLSTKGDGLFNFGGNQDIEVGGKLTEHVKGAVKETYDTSQDTTVSGPLKEHVTGAVTLSYDATQTTTVAGEVSETYQSGQTTNVTGHVDATYNGPSKLTVNGPTTATHNGPHTTTVAGPVTQTFAATVTQSYGPTKANYASLDWTIPGGAKILTPEWKVVSPEEGWVTATAKHIFGEDLEVTGLKRELVGVAVGVNGMVAEHTGVHVEFANLHIETVGVHVETVGFHGGHEGIELKELGAAIRQAGIHIFK